MNIRKILRIALISTALIAALLVLTSLLSLFPGPVAEKYYGPPKEDAVYESVSNITIKDKTGSSLFPVNESWMGMKIIVFYEKEVSGWIKAISPSGYQMGYFITNISSDDVLNNTAHDQYQIIPLQNDLFYGELYGDWMIEYQVIGGPVYVEVQRIITFG